MTGWLIGFHATYNNNNNYLKLLEYLILPVLEYNLSLSSRQFGFRPGANCQSAVMMLHGVMNSYTELISKIHSAMLDLSKAFDWTNFNILVALLKKTHLSMQFVNFVDFMLRNSFANLNYNGVKGRDRMIGYGARQGGIPSPLLLSSYINQVVGTILWTECRLSLGRQEL